MRNLLLLFACLFLLGTPLHAQDGDSAALEDTPDRAWLGVSIDPHGAATVSFELPAKVSDREQLKRALGDTFSFPLQFHDITEDTDTEESWTTLAAKSEKAFSGGPMQSSCEIDLQSLLLQLQQHHIDRLRIWVVFQNGTQDVHINGAQRFPIKGTLNVDHYEADVYARDAATFPINHFSMGYSAAQRASGQYRER